MISSRFNNRRAGVRPKPQQADSQSTTIERGVSVEESFLSDVDTLPRPAGFGTEASTSTQSFTLVDGYRVPAKTLGRLRELSVSIESNGEVKISVAGTTYGPYTGSADVSIPLDPAVLTEGHKIRIHHQSTDGTSTTTQAQAVVLEV